MLILNADTDANNVISQWNDGEIYVPAHTSGSTGQPKSVNLLKSDMTISARATCDYFGLNSDSFLACPLSANYIAGKMMIVRTIIAGACLYMETPSNRPLNDINHSLSAELRKRPVDLVAIVPSQIPGLIEASLHTSIRNVIIGGANIPPALQECLYTAPFNAYSTYGMTETCSHVALRHIIPGNDTYEALQGYTFSVDDRSCLIIESSKQSFGRLTTNDVVTLIDPYHFVWNGRHDNVIISGGIKIHPEILEQKISHLFPGRFYITGRPDEKWGQHVTLVIEGPYYEHSELMEEINKIIRPHEKPREVIFINKFKETKSGKIIRI